MMMDNDPIDESVRQQYNDEFNSKVYLELYFNKIYTSEKTTLAKLHEYFTTGALKGPLKSCIDIGCGPIVHRFGYPSKVCDTLVYSDFSQNNRQLVEEWLRAPVPDPRHHHLFKFQAEQEGFQDLEKGALEIENRIKSKVKGVIEVDVLNPQPIGQVDQLYDIVFSSACLEAACDSYESYVKAVKNIASILRPGGYFILKGYTDGNYYIVNDTRFPCLNQNADMVKKGLAEAGYQILDFEEPPREEDGILDELKDIDKKGLSNCQNSFVALVQKL